MVWEGGMSSHEGMGRLEGYGMSLMMMEEFEHKKSSAKPSYNLKQLNIIKGLDFSRL